MTIEKLNHKISLLEDREKQMDFSWGNKYQSDTESLQKELKNLKEERVKEIE